MTKTDQGAGITRRAAIVGGATLASTFPRVAIGQTKTKIRIGRPDGISCNAQMWEATRLDAWGKVGLEPEFFKFTTGLELFQAMIGGSLDMLTTGAVLENFTARGQGKVFLINSVEFNTSSLWVRTDQGVHSFADLKGKQISTTRGTTADIFLTRALQANGLGDKSVDVVNQRMNEAVTSFIAGAVPAVALWMPFNVQVQKQVPGAKMLASAGNYFPEAAVPTGWAVTEDYMAKNRETLQRVVRAWAIGNQSMLENPEPGLAFDRSHYISQVSSDDLRQMYAAQKMYSAADWRKMYLDGTVTGWLDGVTRFFEKTGPISNPVRAAKYFDPSIFLDTLKA